MLGKHPFFYLERRERKKKQNLIDPDLLNFLLQHLRFKELICI